MGPPVERITALPGFGLNVLSRDFEGFAGGKALNGGALGIEAESGAVLPLRRNPEVSIGVQN